MKLGVLIRRLDGCRLTGDPGVDVDVVVLDSRDVRPGSLFAALPGQRHHGIEFLGEALERGAAAVLSDRSRPEDVSAPWMESVLSRRHTALAAWAVAGDPQRTLRLIAVTGTNGKSTTVDLVSRILEAAGIVAGTFGTLGYRLPTTTVEAERTTPEATQLAPLLARLAAEGGQAAVMEASSHALDQDRLAGLEFEVGVWTNLTRDHLDFHGDMERYFEAKRRLFTHHLAPSGRRVLPVDEPWGARLAADPQPGDVTWGVDTGDVHASETAAGLDGTRFVLVRPDGLHPVALPLVGLHNLRNALAAAAAAWAAGVTAEATVAGLEAARPLPGRLEPVAVDLPFPVFVDFAHTPEGLRAVLASLRAVSDRRLVVVFGAGGDKDRGKRGPMGRAVGELADVALVTSDNPRSEDPATIAAAVAAGVREAGTEPEILIDRRVAIARALELAGADALVVIAGKGHESVQVIGQRRIPFSDAAVVRELVGGRAS